MASDGGDVQVRLSQEGGAEIIDTLKKMGEGIEALSSPAKIAALGASAAGLSEVGKIAIDTMQKLGDLVAEMISVRAEYEQWEIRLAKLNEQFFGWSEAVEHARDSIESLEKMSSGSNTGELVNLFQRLTFLAGGTETQVMKLTQQMTLFGQASGVTAEQLLRVITMAERTGTLPSRPGTQMAVQAIQNILGEDAGAQIKTAADRGQLGALLEQLHLSAEATEALENSWTNLNAGFARSREGIVNLIGEGFEPLKEIVKALTEALSSGGLHDAIKDVVNIFSTVLQAEIDVVKAYGDLIPATTSLKGAFDVLLTPLKIVAAEWIILAGAVREVITAYETIAHRDADGIEGWTNGLKKMGDVASDTAAKVKKLGVLAAFGSEDSNLSLGYGTHMNAQDEPSRSALGNDVTKQAEAADAALEKLFEKVDRQHEMAGLTGINKQIASIRVKADEEIAQIVDLQEKADRLNKIPIRDAETAPGAAAAIAKVRADEAANIAEVRQKQNDKDAALTEHYWAARAKAVEQGLEKERGLTEQFDSLMNSMSEKQAVTALQQIEAKYKKETDALDKQVQKFQDAMLKFAGPGSALNAQGLLVSTSYGPETDEEVAKRKRINDDLARLYAMDAQTKAVIEQQKQADLKTQRDLELQDWDAYYADLIKKAETAGDHTFATVQATGKKVAADAEANAQTFEQGWVAGFKKIEASVTSFGQDVAGLMTSVWGDLSKSFETGFYDILTGKFDSLKDVLKSLWDSILKDFAKMLAQMLERWLITGDAMGNGKGSGGLLGGLLGGQGSGPSGAGVEGTYGPGTTQYGDYVGGGTMQGAGSGGALAGYGGLAAGAMGLYAAGNAISGDFGHNTADIAYKGVNIGNADFGGTAKMGDFAIAAAAVLASMVAVEAAVVAVGLMTAAAAAATVPVVGWIVAAVLLIVGAIMAIFSGPQEGHAKIAMADAFNTSGAKGVIGNFVKEVIDGTATTIADLARSAGQESKAADFIAAYQKSFKDVWGRATFDFAAGNKDDLTADVKHFFEQMLPKMAMQAAFGQIGTGMPLGDRDWIGGTAGTDFNTNNGYMDAAGNWIKKQLFDPSAPIPTLLAGIGFTQDTIGMIAQKLADSSDMAAFKKYLNDLVGVVVSFQDALKKTGWSSAQVMGDITAQRTQTDAEKFTKSGQDLAELAKELSLYTGDDQIAKAKELSGLINQRWADEEAAIAKLMDLSKQIHDSLTASITTIVDTLARMKAVQSGSNPGDYDVNRNLSTLFTDTFRVGSGGGRSPSLVGTGGLMGRIEGASLADLPALAQKAQQLIMDTFNMLVARLQEIYTLQKQNTDLVAAFGTSPSSMVLQATGQAALPLGQGTAAIDIQFMLQKAQASSGQEQLDWIAKLQNAAASRYQTELQQIAAIQNNLKNLTDSVASQKFGMLLDAAKTPADKAKLLTGDVDTLMQQLGKATTPEEVARLTGMIQGDIGQLWNLSDKGPEALRVMNAALDAMDKAARAQYQKLNDAIVADNNKIRQMLIDAGTLLTAAETATKNTMADLQTALQHLDDVVRNKLQLGIDAIVASNIPLNAAIAAAIPLFTDAGTKVAGLGGAADTTRGKFNRLNDAIDGAVTRLDTLGSGPGGGGGVVRTIRDNPNLLASHTGNGL